jgi:hypothetical protein
MRTGFAIDITTDISALRYHLLGALIIAG